MIALETIRREVAAVAAKRGARRAILFGSFARGTATERSDLDLIVVEETGERFLRRAGPYADEIGDRLGLYYTPSEPSRCSRISREQAPRAPAAHQAARRGKPPEAADAGEDLPPPPSRQRGRGPSQTVLRAVPALCVEVLVYTPEELRNIDHRPFIRRALGEGIVLYESGEE
jgi:predicted nucleotidyltransferase